MLHDFTAQQDEPATPHPLAVCVARHYYPSIIVVKDKLRIPRLHRKYHCVPTPQSDANLHPSERVRTHHVGGQPHQSRKRQHPDGV
jgi:hypothetical protein